MGNISVLKMLVAAFGLLVVFQSQYCSSTVTVIGKFNETLYEADDAESAFGASVPSAGFSGYLMYANPADACTQIDNPPNISGSNVWIALIMRNNCYFDEKVFNAQRAGYHAAIVYNNHSDVIFNMHGSIFANNVTIPSVFIGSSDGKMLQQYSGRIDVHIVIYSESGFRSVIYFVLMGCIGLIGILIGVCIVVINWSCNRAKQRKSLLSKRKLKKLPIHRFKTGDLYDTCAICLEEYVDDDKLRLLPCAHAFHCKCIDPWLTEKKNTCPLCKDVVCKPRNKSTSINCDETQPLINENNEEDSIVHTATTTNAFNTIAEVHSAPHPRHRSYGSMLASPSVPTFSSPVVEEVNNEESNKDGATVTVKTTSDLPASDNCEA